MFHIHNHISEPSPVSLQYVHVSSVLDSSNLNSTLQVWHRQWLGEGDDHIPDLLVMFLVSHCYKRKRWTVATITITDHMVVTCPVGWQATVWSLRHPTHQRRMYVTSPLSSLCLNVLSKYSPPWHRAVTPPAQVVVSWSNWKYQGLLA